MSLTTLSNISKSNKAGSQFGGASQIQTIVADIDLEQRVLFEDKASLIMDFDEDPMPVWVSFSLNAQGGTLTFKRSGPRSKTAWD
jgi:hypothetical protein